MNPSLRTLAFGLLSITAFACSSSDTPADTTGAAGSGAGTIGGAAGYDPMAHKNGVQISEADACKRYVDGVQAQATSRSCAVTIPTCPDFIRLALSGADKKNNYCATWDEGAVKGCVDFLKTLTCDELNTRPCALIYFDGTGLPNQNADGTCKGSGGAGGTGGAGGAGTGGAGTGGSAAGTGGAATGGAGGTGGSAAGAAGAGGSTAGTAGAGGSTAGTAGAGGSTGGAGGAGMGGAATGGSAGAMTGGTAGAMTGGTAGAATGGSAGTAGASTGGTAGAAGTAGNGGTGG